MNVFAEAAIAVIDSDEGRALVRQALAEKDGSGTGGSA